MLPPTDIHLATLDDTPFLVQTKSVPGVILTLALAYAAARWQRPRWSRWGQVILALIWFVLWESADTLHTVGHIRSARRVGAGMNSVLLLWGIQVNQYYNGDVTPRQHVGRAIGGPLMSAALTSAALPIYGLLGRIPVVGAIAEAWLFCNGLLAVSALTPTPHFDGASILKWATVARTGEESLGDEAVQQAGSLTIAGLGLATLILIVRGQWRSALGTLAGAILAAGDLFWLRGRLP